MKDIHNQLIRIDDRLIHGQVVVGWANEIHPEYILIIDDEIAKSDFEISLYLMGVPEGIKGKVLSINNGGEFLKNHDSSSYIVVVRSPYVAYLLYNQFQFSFLNIGGMHSIENKKEITHYLYVNQEDINYIEKLNSKGVIISVQDLPTNELFSIDKLLKKFLK